MSEEQLLNKAKEALAKINEQRKVANKKYYEKKKLEAKNDPKNKGKYCDHCKIKIRSNSLFKTPDGYGTLHKKCYKFKKQLEKYQDNQ